MKFRGKALLLLFCYLLFQNMAFSQLFGVGFRVYNPIMAVRSTTCSGLNGEVFKASMDSDSLFFESTTGISLTIAPAKNKGGPDLNNVPALICDKSNGPTHGRIYICWSSEKNGLRNKDVFLTYSDDKGKTWIEPVLVTYRPNHRAQVMPVIIIDQTTGAVYILYYDSQNYFENTTITDVYLAISSNGGLKFNYYKLNSEPLKINLNTQNRNYLKLSSENGIITAGWNQTGKPKTPLSNVILSPAFLASRQITTNELSFEKTIRFSAEIKISLTSTIDTKLTAALTKPLLAGFETVVVKNLTIKKGINQLLIDTKKLSLAKGNYVLTLYYNGKNDFIWITEE